MLNENPIMRAVHQASEKVTQSGAGGCHSLGERWPPQKVHLIDYLIYLPLLRRIFIV